MRQVAAMRRTAIDNLLPRPSTLGTPDLNHLFSLDLLHCTVKQSPGLPHFGNLTCNTCNICLQHSDRSLGNLLILRSFSAGMLNDLEEAPIKI